ncbi:MxaJ, protein involved in methanol oxidation [Methylophaga frappieri]|jgi:mxaJ protein|uniref:MxaJ, protein involved in methanol oxidation n=1 Tax=Methylophaga frappieri (strain ATCC BAA-2434 / DSM 25690 / JAM7) TaxID=754477 RepID=I1YK17_METFJ|nr:methanol oxidation system protein MoxJ [Methylophaga frappieri]AFJ03260.1 MxaJ, protein involved in methanol oxidation [Methylophaga frappieri]
MIIKKLFNTLLPTLRKSPVMLLATGALMSAPASAADTDLPNTLKVCAASNELPYSNAQEEGFENDIAKILGRTMDMPVEFVWSDKAAIFLVTEHLLKNDCDVVMGVDTDDPRVATSDPYYTSGYVFIYRDDKNLDITSWESPDLQKVNKFVMLPGSPSEVMLREIGKYEGNFNYSKSLYGFKSPRNKYIRLDPRNLIGELETNKGDIAHLWAPEVARYVESANVPLTMVMSEEIADTGDGEGVRQHYPQSVAVRTDDEQLLQAINRALNEAAPQITAVLEKEGVPLL